jgi:hypothetical protein
MDQPKVYTEAEAERFFAIRFHGKTWDLLDKPDRTPADNEVLVDYVHASLAHWRTAGTPLHEQRGLWFLSRVYSVLGQVQSALYYANRCQELTLAHPELMQDFDTAFAFEALARAHALAGNKAEMENYLHLAQQAGDAIQEEEDRKIFKDSLAGGDWYGLISS